MARKRFRSTLLHPTAPARTDFDIGAIPPPVTRVEFAWTSAGMGRTFDFGPFYGHGSDPVVAHCQKAIEWRLMAGVHRVSTISNACQVALRRFFQFCNENAADAGGAAANGVKSDLRTGALSVIEPASKIGEVLTRKLMFRKSSLVTALSSGWW